MPCAAVTATWRSLYPARKLWWRSCKSEGNQVKIKALISVLLCVIMLAGCAGGLDATGGAHVTPGENGTTQTVIQNPDALFTDRDLAGTYEETGAATIRFEETAVSSDSASVTVTGTTATITAAGTYILEGNCSDGAVAVYASKEDKVQLVLKGLTLCSKDGAAIHVIQANKVFVTLASGSENALSNGGSFETDAESKVDAVIFSKEDLTCNGSGSLTVTSPAGHGIISKDELTVAGGTYQITAASQGIVGKDNVCIAGGTMTISSGKDGIHAENADDASLGFVYIKGGTFCIDAQGDGISASSVLQIDGGGFSIVTGGGSENGEDHTSDGWGDMPGGGGHRPGGRPGGRAVATETDTEDSASIKGLKAVAALVINNGNFTIDAADDAVHANGNVTVTGGNFAIESGDDGFHADETLAISGGTIVIKESYEGLEGLHIAISGGNIEITASDDGINAAGGTDESGFGGGRGDRFGGDSGGGFGGGMMGGASNGSVVISGGEIFIFAGGDGIDANGSLTVTGGKVTVHGPTVGDTAVLDYDTTATISGGTFIGTGAMNMAQTFSSSENQGLISVSVGSNVAAGTKITLADSKGNVVLEVTPDQNFAIVIISSPEIQKGQTYTITVGTSSGKVEAE